MGIYGDVTETARENERLKKQLASRENASWDALQLQVAALRARLAAAERERDSAIETNAGVVRALEKSIEAQTAAEAALAQEQERNRNNVANADTEIRDLRTALEREQEKVQKALGILQQALAALSPSPPALPENVAELRKLEAMLNDPSPSLAGKECVACGAPASHWLDGAPYCNDCGKPAPAEKGEEK